MQVVIPGPRSGTRNPEPCPWSSCSTSWTRTILRRRRSGFRVPLRGPGMTSVSRFCQEMSGISSCFIPTPKTSRIIHPAPSAGTPIMTVIAWGGDGASGVGQRNPRPERPRPRVPLPPLRAVRAGRAHRPEANAQKPKAGRQRVSGAAERTRTEIAGRAAARSR